MQLADKAMSIVDEVISGTKKREGQQMRRASLEVLEKEIKEAFQKILNTSVKVVVDTDIDPDGNACLEVGNGSYLLTPCTMREDTLFGVQEFEAWALERIYTVHNYPHEPDDVDYAEMVRSRNVSVLVSNLVKAYIEDQMANYFENKMYEELARERAEASRKENSILQGMR